MVGQMPKLLGINHFEFILFCWRLTQASAIWNVNCLRFRPQQKLWSRRLPFTYRIKCESVIMMRMTLLAHAQLVGLFAELSRIISNFRCKAMAFGLAHTYMLFCDYTPNGVRRRRWERMRERRDGVVSSASVRRLQSFICIDECAQCTSANTERQSAKSTAKIMANLLERNHISSSHDDNDDKYNYFIIGLCWSLFFACCVASAHFAFFFCALLQRAAVALTPDVWAFWMWIFDHR